MTNIVPNKNGVEIDVDAIASDLNMKLEKDLVNITDAGKVKIAHNAMPSNTYEILTVGASATAYQAPADGYFVVRGISNVSTRAFVVLGNMDARRPANSDHSYSTSTALNACIPIKKGEQVVLSYDGIQDSTGTYPPLLTFIYAVGSESEAS